MTPPRRKTTFYVAGLVGAVAAGFASHWVVPLAAPSGNAAIAAPEASFERRLVVLEQAQAARLVAVEQAQAKILTELGEVKDIVAYLKCRTNLGNVCPPEGK